MTNLQRITDLAGYGGRVTVWTVSGDPMLYVGTETGGVGVVVGLEDDDVRQLVAVLERQLRARAAGRRLDPAGECVCGHSRAVHQDGEAACRDDALCRCLVMRPVSVIRTVQSCTTSARRPSEQDVSLLDAIPEPTRSTVRRML